MNSNETLRRIARYLMLYTSHQNNLGLLNGKTGIAIFFFHYGRYTGRKVFRDFAGELVSEIRKEVHVNSPCNFRDGLPGIAWSVEYLVRNRFAEGETDDILEELDRKILERDVRYLQDYTLETGLKGLAYYVISRCASRERSNRIIPDAYILDLIKALRSNGQNEAENAGLIGELEGIPGNREVASRLNPIDKILEKTTFGYDGIFQPGRPLGISRNGYAGIGLAIIRKNDETKSVYI